MYDKRNKHLQRRFMPTNPHAITVRDFCSCVFKTPPHQSSACVLRARPHPTGSFPVSQSSHRDKRMAYSCKVGQPRMTLFLNDRCKTVQQAKLRNSYSIKSQQHKSIYNHFRCQIILFLFLT